MKEPAMSRQQSQGPFCQSCSMPLEKADDFGTDVAGFRVNDYCRHCYVSGAFTEPQITMAAMIDRCVAIMAQRRVMSEPDARALLTRVMPTLKRWRVARREVAAATPF